MGSQRLAGETAIELAKAKVSALIAEAVQP